jgi:hypothetical protein
MGTIDPVPAIVMCPGDVAAVTPSGDLLVELGR